MRPKSLILLVLALGCGLVASIGINQVMANRNSDGSAAVETTQIFVALKEIRTGDPLNSELLKLQEWPRQQVPAGALTRIEDVEGRRAKTRIVPGEPILDDKLLKQGESAAGGSDLLRPGYRGVAVRVDAQSGLSGLILPGDKVDVQVHLAANPARGIPITRTLTFLRNIKVFAVDDVFKRGDDGSQAIAAKTVTLEVTPEESEYVTLASKLGEIQLVMRSATDEDTDGTGGGVTIDQLLQRAGLPGAPRPEQPPQAGFAEGLLSLLDKQKPKTEPEPAPIATPAEPEPPAFRMLLLRGSDASQVQFDPDSRLARPADQNRTAPRATVPSEVGPNLGPPEPQAADEHDAPSAVPDDSTTGDD